MTYSAERNSLILPPDLDLLASHARSAPPGAFVEVGVYRGGSARVLYPIAEEQNRILFLFDTFTGHPSPSEHDDPTHKKGRFADCIDPETLKAELPNAQIIKGRFQAMAPFWKHWSPVAFAHIDVDLYESTRDAIKILAPYLVPGGLIYVDDYGVPECPGATRAVDELLPDRTLLPNGKAIWRHP